MPQSIGAVISSGKATLHEMQTIYGLQDVHEMLEVLSVDAYNIKRLTKNVDHH